MKKFNIPQNVTNIIQRLENAGYRADIVGGCVRDLLLGKEPSDYDITTSATPEETEAVFSDVKVIKTGIKHGTVTVVYDSVPYEITTYRIDGEYTDKRHPDSVKFTRDISDDLARRDFTVNAMAYNERRGIFDIYSGREDLCRGIIRAVGDPVVRFSEDALRILRALRFSSVLDFKIEEKTGLAVREMSPTLINVSAERIYSEWKKLIGGIGAYRVLSEYREVISSFMPSLSGMKLPEESRFHKAEPALRELSLFALNSAAAADEFYSSMTNLKTDTEHKKRGREVLENRNFPTESEKDIHKLLIKLSDASLAKDVISLRVLLGETEEDSLLLYDRLIKKNACFKISDLEVDGNDLKKIGIEGRGIKDAFMYLLSEIAEGNVKNEKSELLACLSESK